LASRGAVHLRRRRRAVRQPRRRWLAPRH